jgi:trigger factor
MERELGQTLKTQLKEEVIAKLLEKNELDLPAALVDQEVNALREQAKQRFSQQGGGQNLPDLPADLFKDNAQRRVSIGLLLGEIIKQNDLKADQEKVDSLIETMASAYEDPQEVVDYYKNNQELMQQMQNVALEEQAIEWVVGQAKVTEVNKPFDEVMNKQG